MAKIPSGRRYAQAVLQIALEHDSVEEWINDISALVDVQDDRDFILLMDSPEIPMEDKENVIKVLLEGNIGQLAVNLMCSLASRGQVAELPGIAESYQELVDRERAIERVEIVSAVELSKEETDEIVTKLEKMVGRKLVVTKRIDASIIGGFIADLGDRIIDGSVKSQFRDLRRTLVGTQ